MPTTPVTIDVANPAPDVFVVWGRRRGVHTPLASCGSAAQADIVSTALELMAEQQSEVLLAKLDALPRVSVPTAHGLLP